MFATISPPDHLEFRMKTYTLVHTKICHHGDNNFHIYFLCSPFLGLKVKQQTVERDKFLCIILDVVSLCLLAHTQVNTAAVKEAT